MQTCKIFENAAPTAASCPELTSSLQWACSKATSPVHPHQSPMSQPNTVIKRKFRSNPWSLGAAMSRGCPCPWVAHAGSCADQTCLEMSLHLGQSPVLVILRALEPGTGLGCRMQGLLGSLLRLPWQSG